MKKLFLIAIVAAWIPGAILFWGPVPAHTQEIDRLLAAVNGKIVTELDLGIARTLDAVLQFGKNAALQSRQKELDRLINQELIRQEMENYPIPESDRAEVEREVQAQLENLRDAYAEIGGLPALLRQLGLQQDELVAKVRTLVLSEKFISLRFGPFITVTDAEVEAYYSGRLLPQLRERGIDIPPPAAVAAQISALLREEKKNQAWLQWIDNIKIHSRIEFFAGGTNPPALERR
jgi:hypothetical protein